MPPTPPTEPLPTTSPTPPAAPTTSTEAGTGRPSTRRDHTARFGMAVTDRVLLALVTIAALGLVAVTAVFWWSHDSVREQQVDASLAQEIDELRTLADATDPATGEPFASVDALLGTFVSRNVPNDHEGFLVLVDGTVPFVPPYEERVVLEDMDPVVDLARAVRPGDPSASHEVRVGDTDLQVVTVPVAVAGDDAHGVLVVAADRTAADGEFDRARLAQGLLVAATALAIGLLAAGTVGHLLRPLRTLADTAERITEEDLAERIPVSGADDIAHLTRTVNSMLDRLESAFDGQRALLDDVGHELRTPLTVIRGQLEVMDADDPQDVRETRDLVTDEADRMARLVEELVLLAKSMRPDFVTLRSVAIDEVVESLLERAPRLGDRRFRLDHLCGARVEGDTQRLVQAGLQLLSNAVRHTDTDDEIGVGAAVDGDVVRLWVRDTGEGVPAEDQERIFERAVRGAGVGTTADTSSSGLGLSIVQAIAHAHGGRVTLTSTHGAGATFALEIPLAAVPADAQGPTDRSDA